MVNKSDKTPWYEGPTLLNYLETVPVVHKTVSDFFRFPVQYVIRPISSQFPDYRGYAGRVSGGIIRPGDKIRVLPSGTESIVKTDKSARIFTLDTGRLFPETYQLIDKTNMTYGINLEVFFPNYEAVQQMVKEEGINLFYNSIESRHRCCQVRKLEPLKRAMQGLDVWICGLRKQQSVTRKDMQVVEWDDIHNLIKVNPLINWSEEDVEQYVKKHHVPYNKLQDKGYPSIGCQPCTRAIKPGEDIRAGNRSIRKYVYPLLDILAGLPSVIYGVWGSLLIVPWVSKHVAPLFVEFSSGYTVLAGGIVLSVMIIPLLVSLFMEIFDNISTDLREASLSLGATQWQTIKHVVLRKARPGMIAAVVLALSRTLGETIAVLMVCGNLAIVPGSVLDACYSIPPTVWEPRG